MRFLKIASNRRIEQGGEQARQERTWNCSMRCSMTASASASAAEQRRLGLSLKLIDRSVGVLILHRAILARGAKMSGAKMKRGRR